MSLPSAELKGQQQRKDGENVSVQGPAMRKGASEIKEFSEMEAAPKTQETSGAEETPQTEETPKAEPPSEAQFPPRKEDSNRAKVSNKAKEDAEVEESPKVEEPFEVEGEELESEGEEELDLAFTAKRLPWVGGCFLFLLGGLMAGLGFLTWQGGQGRSLGRAREGVCGRAPFRKGTLRILVFLRGYPEGRPGLALLQKTQHIHSWNLSFWQRLTQEARPRVLRSVIMIQSGRSLDRLPRHEARKQASMYGKLCRAHLVIAISARTTTTASATRSTAPPAQAQKAQLGLWALSRGPLQARWEEEQIPLGPLRELWQPFSSASKALRGLSLRRLVRGLAYLTAANRIEGSVSLALSLHREAYRSLSRFQPGAFRRYGEALQRWQRRRPALSPMITVPRGPFLFGPSGSFERRDLPAFQIDRYEVSREEYALCVLQGDCSPPPNFLEPPWNIPQDRITHEAAARYCYSLGKALPTEEQWVKAARGGLRLGDRANPFPGRPYPWGREPPTCSRANIRWCFLQKNRSRSKREGKEKSRDKDKAGQEQKGQHKVQNKSGKEKKRSEDKSGALPLRLPVHRRLAGLSPYGVAHLIGNVSEFVQDGGIKGGSGVSEARKLSWKGYMDQRSGLSWVGFRCVKNDLRQPRPSR